MYAMVKSIILYDRFYQAWINEGITLAWSWAHNRYQTIVAPGVKQLYLHRFCMKGCTVII